VTARWPGSCLHCSSIAAESLFLISLRNPRGGKKKEGKFEAVSAVSLENKSLIEWASLFISCADGKKLE